MTGEVREQLEGDGEGKEMKWNKLNNRRGDSVGGAKLHVRET